MISVYCFGCIIHIYILCIHIYILKASVPFSGKIDTLSMLYNIYIYILSPNKPCKAPSPTPTHWLLGGTSSDRPTAPSEPGSVMSAGTGSSLPTNT